jgi:hypothetical protein
MCAFFLRKKYTTFSTEEIVALRSVNKIFPESYDFAAMMILMSRVGIRMWDMVTGPSD